MTTLEREVLALMAQGRSNWAIAADLRVNPKTVETQIASIFTKLSVVPDGEENRRVLAVLAYLGSERPRRSAEVQG